MSHTVEEGKSHSLLAPSSSSRWITCPGSVQKCKDLPREQSGSAALRGTRIHYLGESILNAYLNGDENYDKIFDELKETQGDQDCNGPFKIESDMLREAINYANYCIDLTKHYDQDKCKIIAELNVDLSEIAENTAGHADAVVLVPNNQGYTLHIVDLKTGTTLVNALGNSQLRLYGYGAFLEYELEYDITEVQLHIYQNNQKAGKNISYEVIAIDKLLTWIDNVVKPAADEAMNEDAKCVPGEKQCEWCPAASFCKEAHEFGVSMIDDMFESLQDETDSKPENVGNHITIEQCSEFLQNMKMIQKLAKSYESRIEKELQNGKKVPGYKLVLSKHNKKWTNELEVYDKLKKWAPIDEIAPRKLVTPNQAETILGNMSTQKKNKFAEMWVRPEGKPVMAPESDKREAIKPVVDDFEDLVKDIDEDDDFLA